MKHLSSPTLLSLNLKKLRLVALACGLFLFMGASAYGQKPAPCTSNPVTTAKPYVGYNGLTNETAALYSWCKNEPIANIQTYCTTLTSAIDAVANYNTLSDGCKAEYRRRKQELQVIAKLTQARH